MKEQTIYRLNTWVENSLDIIKITHQEPFQLELYPIHRLNKHLKVPDTAKTESLQRKERDARDLVFSDRLILLLSELMTNIDINISHYGHILFHIIYPSYVQIPWSEEEETEALLNKVPRYTPNHLHLFRIETTNNNTSKKYANEFYVSEVFMERMRLVK